MTETTEGSELEAPRLGKICVLEVVIQVERAMGPETAIEWGRQPALAKFLQYSRAQALALVNDVVLRLSRPWTQPIG